jgi:hypothetical protein
LSRRVEPTSQEKPDSIGNHRMAVQSWHSNPGIQFAVLHAASILRCEAARKTWQTLKSAMMARRHLSMEC